MNKEFNYGHFTLEDYYQMFPNMKPSKGSVSKLIQENKQLKDNWNKLKKIVKSQSGFKKRADLKGGLWFEVDELLNKIQELESDNNE